MLCLGGCVKNDDKFSILLPDLSDEPLHIGKRLDIEDIQNKCSEIERGSGSVHCHIETEKVFINLTIAKNVVTSIYIREVDDYENTPAFLTDIMKDNKLKELNGMPIKGEGDIYRLGDEELKITYNANYHATRRYYHLFLSSIQEGGKEELIKREGEFASKVGYTSFYDFKLSEQLMGRSPIGYDCRGVYLVDLTICNHRVYLNYLLDSQEDTDLKEPVVTEPHVILMDGLEVVALHYSFKDYSSVNLNKLFGIYGGKMKFTQSSYRNEIDINVAANEFYTVNERGDLIIINKIGSLNFLSIDLYANDSIMKYRYIKHQDASLNSQ